MEAINTPANPRPSPSEISKSPGDSKQTLAPVPPVRSRVPGSSGNITTDTDLISRLQPTMEAPDDGFKLDVPFEPQLNIGAHVEGATPRDDPSGCWYACACMVAHYFVQGPRLGNPDFFSKAMADGQMAHNPTSNVKGTYRQKIVQPGIKFLRIVFRNQNLFCSAPRYVYNEGLRPVMNCRPRYKYTISDIKKMLIENGPIIMIWRKSKTNAAIEDGSIRKFLHIHKAPETYHHASVIIGTQTNNIIYHDPERKEGNSLMSIEDFNNNRLRRGQYDLMQSMLADKYPKAE